jgi:hypothetical protein
MVAGFCGPEFAVFTKKSLTSTTRGFIRGYYNAMPNQGFTPSKISRIKMALDYDRRLVHNPGLPRNTIARNCCQ